MAYAFRASGTVDYDTSASNALTPGAPAGKAVGDLLVLYSTTRVAGQTMTSLSPGWTQIIADGANDFSYELWLRIADGTATDTPTVQWSGTTADAAAWIDAYHGGGYTDLSTIVVHEAEGNTNTTSDLMLPTLTITTDNCLVIAMSAHYKTTASNDATTITANGGLTKSNQHIQAGNAAFYLASGYMIQTTSTNYDGSDFTRDGSPEASIATIGVVVALQAQSVAGTVVPLLHHLRMMGFR